jgi:hypothetical protein
MHTLNAAKHLYVNLQSMGSLLEHNESTKFVGMKLNNFDFFDF